MPNDQQKVRIFETLKHWIVHLKLLPYQRLTEIKLSQEFGCSRTPVREALMKLTQEGWIVMVPNQGYYVRGIRPKELEDLYELLITLEKMAISLVTSNKDQSVIKKLHKKWNEKPRAWEDTVGLQLIADDEEFHEEIAFASDNNELHSSIKKINEKIHIIRRIDYNNKDWARNIVNDHVEILDSILQRNTVQAEQLIEKHIRSNKETMMSLINVYLGESLLFS
ncbi:transcriptional regulator, GntR family [Paenibacillus sp. yr247]|uniref:GntR family transcriptional regulator n=1 Tax=Paenibacillus sp. yr247 TaxID=1761880 RepID=UPI0008901B10|nr:GntR family transcriptional regulator [Paenibacillus sp. yr247]SDO33219.1 transcriptional regulator, GntR family [Paenibacillus sp. yr247]